VPVARCPVARCPFRSGLVVASARDMAAKQLSFRARRLGFLSLCVLLLAWTGCEPEACMSSAECGAGEICAGPGAGPYHCLKDCTRDDACPAGYGCVGVTSADCPVCQVVTNACLLSLPHALF
jgi:hypothetical protein